MEKFTGSFTQQEPIPEAGIAAAMAVLQHGRLHRYNVAPGEVAETALLEEEFAALTGARYCLAVASGGYAMGCALRALGVAPGDAVLSNGFTLAPVPGAIASVGARPVFVEITDDLVLDFADLEAKAACGAKVLLLSHMRGHVCDMDALMTLCDRLGLQVIEDCAHTMGGSWKGVPSGRHGVVACYSAQTYKHVNSGEGGFLTSDDPQVMARAVLLSGSYMLYAAHRAAPPPEAFEAVRMVTPNISGRMDNLRAAILRPQLATLAERVGRWTARYRTLESGLRDIPGLTLIHRPDAETYVGSSFQFRLADWSKARIGLFLTRALARGVELKWFGADQPMAFTSRYDHWRYARVQSLPRTDRILAGLVDMRVPLTFSVADCVLIARILREEALVVGQGPEPEGVMAPQVQ
ncbi:MAG: DegT/DnrJ/EryC1/StrS family aminotransferase [Pseudorhodobacter sp.]|nr:DegT/DnrJ/EryC1/StrS family aminotransferase [Pseudorhodobacter sp.]